MIRDGIIDEIFVIKTFKSFHSDEDFTNNLSELIQSLATRIADLIENKKLLHDERKKASQLRMRFGGSSGGDLETSEKDAEKHIQEQIDKCAKKADEVDPRYGGFSSEDYMKEQERKQAEQKFVGSLGKDDEEVESEFRKRGKGTDREEAPVARKKKTMPKPPSKKGPSSLRKRLGIPPKKETSTAHEEDADVDFLAGSAKKEGARSVTSGRVEDPMDLVDLTNGGQLEMHEEAPMDLMGPANSDDTDLIDFGMISSVSNTGQSGNDVDLLVGGNSGKMGMGNPGTGGTQSKPQMFSDINTDLLDLTGLSLGGPVTGSSSSGQGNHWNNVQSTGMSSANQKNPAMPANMNSGQFGQPVKKDLDINEFDFI